MIFFFFSFFRLIFWNLVECFKLEEKDSTRYRYICGDAEIRMRVVVVYFLTNLDSPRVSEAVCLLALLRWVQLGPPLGYTEAWDGKSREAS